MNMKYKIEIAPLSDYYVVVVRDKDNNDLKDTFTINEIGADMLRLFSSGKDKEAIAKEIASMYEAPISVITKDVEKFEEHLRKKDLI